MRGRGSRGRGRRGRGRSGRSGRAHGVFDQVCQIQKIQKLDPKKQKTKDIHAQLLCLKSNGRNLVRNFS
jgi:hypothetical protein